MLPFANKSGEGKVSMTAPDFKQRIESNDRMVWMGIKGTEPDSAKVCVGVKTEGLTGGMRYWQIPFRSIGSYDWEEVESVLTGARPARCLIHITRIVGYFSQINNWNRSKLAELADRRKGQYVIREAVIHGIAGDTPETQVQR